eukprot:IDg7195t1
MSFVRELGCSLEILPGLYDGVEGRPKALHKVCADYRLALRFYTVYLKWELAVVKSSGSLAWNGLQACSVISEVRVKSHVPANRRRFVAPANISTTFRMIGYLISLIIIAQCRFVVIKFTALSACAEIRAETFLILDAYWTLCQLSEVLLKVVWFALIQA